jgi:hypothetical protein
MTAILRQRSLSEAEAETVRKDRVPATVLASLFDLSKSATSRDELEKLARDHNVDVQTLEHLLRHFTTPSIKAELSGPRNDTETLTVCPPLLLPSPAAADPPSLYQALWTDPPVLRERKE